MATAPIVDSKTGKVVGVCWAKECALGCGRDVLDLAEDEHLCKTCNGCPRCCSGHEDKGDDDADG